MKKLKVIFILLLLLSLSLMGCVAVEKESHKTIVYKLSLMVYYGTCHQLYNPYYYPESQNYGWGPSNGKDGATIDHYWVQVRNVGLANLHDIKIIIKDLDDDWKIHDIVLMPDHDGFPVPEWDKRTKTINTLYAQYDKDTDIYHPAYETTAWIRFRLVPGTKGGWDTNGDGMADAPEQPNTVVMNGWIPETVPDPNAVEVGYYPKTYDHTFLATCENTEAHVTLNLEIYEGNSQKYYANEDYPNRY